MPAGPRLRFPHSLRAQFALGMAGLTLLAAAGGVVAVAALRTSADGTRRLAQERLDRLELAQELGRVTALIERGAARLVAAADVEAVRAGHLEVSGQLDLLDGLVERLGAASDDVEVLDLHEAGQALRNTVHVVARLREQLLRGPGGGRTPVQGTRAEEEETLRAFHHELERQSAALIASAQAISGEYTRDYREAVRRLAAASSRYERWVLALLVASAAAAGLVARAFLGRRVMGRLQQVSRHLRHGEPGPGSPRLPVDGQDEIAEMARALERFLEDRRRLAEANRELEAFSYSISHDLRAPLRHVNGFVALLRARAQGALDAQGEHYLDVVTAAGTRMGHLIDDLLSFLRMRRAEMARAQVDVGALVRELVRELAVQAAERDVRWSVGELPTVMADPPMLRLALGNLLSNALKFTRPRPRSEIEVGCASAPADPEVVLFVRDNGVGFDMRYAGKLFRVFQRLHRQEDFEGTGIGLAHVRRVAERHGGRAWAASAPGQGATFFLGLPRDGLAGPQAGGRVTPTLADRSGRGGESAKAPDGVERSQEHEGSAVETTPPFRRDGVPH